MANSELTVTVEGRFSISDETAERCLRLLEMWQDDNPDKFIECERKETEYRVMHKYSIKRYENPTSAIFRTMNENGGQNNGRTE